MWDNTPWIDPSISPYPYDPDQAKALLDEAGWTDTNGDGTRDKDGVELVLRYGTTTREIRQDTQAVVQQQFQDLGIGLELKTYDSDIFFNSYGDQGPMYSGELDISQFSTAPAYPDPDTADFLCSEIPSDENPAGVNYMLYCDEELDALFRQQASQVDPAEREATMHQITKYMFDNVYWLGVWQDPDLWGIAERIHNVKLSGTNPFFNVAEWEIVE
jgi:peptide/nickel transport system substrate-binding protein